MSRQNPQLAFYIAFFVLFLIDLYVFKGVKLITSGIQNETLRKGMLIAFWVVNLTIIGVLLYIGMNFSEMRSPKNGVVLQTFMGLLMLSLIPKLIFGVFHLVEDISFAAYWVYSKFFTNPAVEPMAGETITRFQFLTQAGALLSLIPVSAMAYGIVKGRYDFTVRKEKLKFPNFPAGLNGLRIVQLSDLHIGSFNGDHAVVKRGIDMVNELEPDIIFFTGDLVNNYAAETDGWKEVLSGLQAKYGKFSILGNHDYGDYVPWDSPELKKSNLDALKQFHTDIGFRLLLNECLPFGEGENTIGIAGIENWGTGGFAQYGRLDLALKDAGKYPFTMLLSHDPSHWDAQVLGKANVDIAFAGHTHGMQFGVSLGAYQYSPVQHRYPRWGGLYREASQYLYVNRGFGFLAFPGRVGMPPEITLIELENGG